MRSEIRRDYIQEKYVLIAPKRGQRPHAPEEILPQPKPQQDCVFCPEKVAAHNIVDRIGGKGRGWQVAAIKNRYPAVTLHNPKAYGTQEVIIDTPEHEPELEEFMPQQVVRLLQMYQRRVVALSALPDIDYVLTFKNHGGRAGASVDHSHSQIFATKFLPPQIVDKSRRVKEYHIRTGRCPYCDVVRKEKKSPRWIWSDKNIACFAPYAPMHNYETWIMPVRHLDNIVELNEDELQSFAYALQRVVGNIVRLGLPYNFYFHQVVSDTDQHLYMKVVPRGSIWAGVEIGSGLIINHVPPEDSAKEFRKGWNHIGMSKRV